MDFAHLFLKIKDNVFIIPQEKFDALTSDKGYLDSFVYLLVCTVFSSIVYLALGMLAPEFMYGSAAMDLGTAGTPSVPELAVQRFLLALPIAYVSFGFLHLLLKLFGGKGNFKHSVQIFVYGTTGSTLFGAIPLVRLIFMLVCLVNTVSGAVRVHKLGLWKAIAALFVVPMIVVFVVALLAAGALMSTGALPVAQ